MGPVFAPFFIRLAHRKARSLLICRDSSPYSSRGWGGTGAEERFFSGNDLGESAKGELDLFDNYGFSALIIDPLDVGLPGGDADGDGIPNGYEVDLAP